MVKPEFPGPEHQEYFSKGFLEAVTATTGVELLKVGDLVTKQSPHQIGDDKHDGTL